MALPTYQSIQSNTSTSTSCVVTKPTSLAVGDLMVAIGLNHRGSGSQAVALPSGFTSVHTFSENFMGYALGWKIADSADVAASNFTFLVSATPDDFMCHLIRVTASTSFSSPIINNTTDTDTSTTTTPTFGISFDPFSTDTLLIATYYRQNTTGGVSAYAFSTNNPTWTERYDRSDADASMAIATAQSGTTNTFTSFSVTTVNSDDRNYLSLVAIGEVTNQTVDVSHLSVTPTINSVEVSNSATADVSHLNIPPTLNSIEAENSTENAVWTTITKS